MTQIIERVARAIWEKDHTGNAVAEGAVPYEEVKWIYIESAQAALEEIKFEQLVGALKEAHDKIDDAVAHLCIYIRCPSDDHDVLASRIGGTRDRIDALISELEKTE